MFTLNFATMKHLLYLFVCLTCMTAKAQLIENSAISVGYQYLGRHSLSLGTETKVFAQDERNSTGLTAGLGIRYLFNGSGYPDVIPEGSLAYRRMFFYGKLQVSPQHINPNIGLQMFNMMSLHSGYSWNLGDNHSGIKGFTIGLNISLGGRNFYDKLYY